MTKKKHGVKKARQLYVFHAFKFIRPYSIRKLSIHSPTDMLKNYLTIGLRNLLNQKLYAFLNIFGLAIGLACFILIMHFVQHELSYDRFHEKADRIYRIVQRMPTNVYLGSDYFAVTPALLGRDLVEEFSEVTDATTLGNPEGQESLISIGNQHFWEKGFWVDANLFNVFTFPLLQGNPETALAEPNSMVLTESLAHKIFGDQDPMGQILLYRQQVPYKVTGVMADVPETSHFTFEFVMAARSHPNYAQSLAEQQWMQNAWYTYFVLAEGADAEQFQEKMRAFVDRHRYADRQDEPVEKRVQFYIQPLNDIHLHSQVNFEIGMNGDIKYVYLFSAIAFIILLLACVNYTNLAIARSIKRAREVGMRKAIGARRGQLISQFLGESVLMAFLAVVLALGLVHLTLPVFGHLVARPLQIDYVGNALLLPKMLGLALLVGLLSGSYPAFFMASLNPIQVLKGKMDGKTGKFSVQRLLLLGQYAVSIVLVAGSLVIYQQLQYIQHKELGYDREHVVTLPVRDEAIRQNYATLRERWLRDPHVVAVSSSRSLPTNITASTGFRDWEGSHEEDDFRIYQMETDYDFLDVFGIELAAGRNFSREFISDMENASLINETAARTFGWTPEEAVGKHFRMEGDQTENTIIGVVKDFHMHSMHLPIAPVTINLSLAWMGYISVKVQPADLTGTIAFLERSMKQFSSYPFEYQFLDEQFDQLYKKEIRLGETFGFFTILALLIASLGLFGLAAFTAEQRTKEVGIRKVMGASVRSIVTLLSKDFLKLVALSFLLATPVAWYAMHQWLQDFAYRIDIQWWMFALAGILALLIAWLTISYQSIRAAIINPVDSLRNE